MVYKPKKRVYRKRGRKSSYNKKIQKYINSHADKKFSVTTLTTGTASLPTYSTASNPFLAVDIVNITTGLSNENRIGQRVTALSLNLRMSFEIPTTASALNKIGFVRYFVVLWPNKPSATQANDMHAVLDDITASGTSTSFAILYNSPLNTESQVKYRVLKQGRFSMVQSTATQLKTLSLNIPIKNKVIDFGPFSTGTPLYNRVTLFMMSDNNTIRYSYYAKIIYIDV